MSTGETWRLFIAIELPSHVLASLRQTQDQLKKIIPARAAKWVRPEGIHLTLKFLGDIPAARRDELIAGIEKAASGHAPFEVRVQGLGCFPNAQRPRVLWVGVGGDIEKLRALQSSVEETIAPLGFPTEARGFNPHLTLARVANGARREDLEAIGRAASDGKAEPLAAWQAEAVSLMRSHLRPEGATYEAVSVVHLES